MTLPRGLLIATLLATVGVGLVLLRQDMARASHRIQGLHHRKGELEQTLWARQMDLARLRVPQRVRQRVTDLGLTVVPQHVERRAAHAPEAQGNGIVRTHD